jgi:phenylacetate-CoA ligase
MDWFKKQFWRTYLRLSWNVLDRYRALRKDQWLPVDDARKVQHARLEKILCFAWEHTAYYRSILEAAKVVTNGKCELSNFQTIPFLTKDIIRKNESELHSSDLSSRNFWYNTSGGSTGEPVRFIQDREYANWHKAIVRLYNEWTGYEVGLPRICLWGSERDIMVGRERVKTYLARWLQNEYWLNAFKMSERNLPEYVQQISRIKPVGVLAYTESLYEVARYVRQSGTFIPAIRSVLCTAGTLYPHVRAEIETAMGSPIFNLYGSREVGGMACECEQHAGLHIAAPLCHIELVDEEGWPVPPGVKGEIVVTSLTNFAMPLIRFRIGDMAEWHPEPICPCGRWWPRLLHVSGRVSDIFVNPKGDRIHGEYFTHLFYHKSWVRKFQCVQETKDLIQISLVANDPNFPTKPQAREELELMKKNIRLVMGDTCRVEFLWKETIPPTASGKYRYTISKVSA